jgi:regulator of PEP synthase PpsR (kinase-PPPase family)
MYQIFAASDVTGTTAERVLIAALTQFDTSHITATRSGGIRSAENISGLVHEAANKQGFIAHTFVSEELRG